MRKYSINTYWNNLPKHQGLMCRADLQLRMVLIFCNSAFGVLACSARVLGGGQTDSHQKNFTNQKRFGDWKQELTLSGACAPLYFFNPIPKSVWLDFLVWFVLGTNFSQSKVPERLRMPVPLKTDASSKPFLAIKPQLLSSGAINCQYFCRQPASLASLQQENQWAYRVVCSN